MEWIQMKDYINLMAGWNVRLVSICNAKRRGDCRSYKARDEKYLLRK